MPIEFSNVIAGKSRGNGGIFSVQSIDLAQLGERASPVEVLDQFRVRSRPFGANSYCRTYASAFECSANP
jgi:hypothetical protein